ncbi:ATP-binding protein [Streptomyces sp. NPDC007084]|uniref:ATP-binding protein n=1 Tax=Streptomyces sp. NPDC007084 TaxID=3154313 RepID=UPI003451B1CB
MAAPVVKEWSMSYTMMDGSVRLTRLHTRRKLTEWQWPGDIHDAATCTSEIVTNAVQHGRVQGRLLLLRLAVLEDGALLIDVSDPAGSFPEFGVAREPGSEDERGRGLALVTLLGGRLSWFLREHIGKTVRVHLPPRAPIPPRPEAPPQV